MVNDSDPYRSATPERVVYVKVYPSWIWWPSRLASRLGRLPRRTWARVGGLVLGVGAGVGAFFVGVGSPPPAPIGTGLNLVVNGVTQDRVLSGPAGSFVGFCDAGATGARPCATGPTGATGATARRGDAGEVIYETHLENGGYQIMVMAP